MCFKRCQRPRQSLATWSHQSNPDFLLCPAAQGFVARTQVYEQHSEIGLIVSALWLDHWIYVIIESLQTPHEGGVIGLRENISKTTQSCRWELQFKSALCISKECTLPVDITTVWLDQLSSWSQAKSENKREPQQWTNMSPTLEDSKGQPKTPVSFLLSDAWVLLGRYRGRGRRHFNLSQNVAGVSI